MKREYAFYSYDFDCIIIQIIFDQYKIMFEWGWPEISEAYISLTNLGLDTDDPLEFYALIPLGEV